jgi:hypothetical protein
MQTQGAVDQIRERLSGIADNYNRLVLLVGRAGTGRSLAIRALADAQNAPVLNLGLDLSRRLLDFGERQRVLQLPRLLEEMIAQLPGDLTLLDNTEVLFNPSLKQDPLRLLQRLSRNRAIVVSWFGKVESGHLTFAEPGHPEFRQYPSDDLLIVPLTRLALASEG